MNSHPMFHSTSPVFCGVSIITIKKLTKKSNITTRVLDNNLPQRYPHITSHYQLFAIKTAITYHSNDTDVAREKVYAIPD
jgi:hypothetical protein